MDHFDQPRLPPELEEQIFVLVADQDLLKAWNYLLVARRVHEWVIRRIFNIVIFEWSESTPIRFNLGIFQRYGKHIHHLFISPSDLLEHLTLFPNITDVVFWGQDYEPSKLEVLLTFKDLTRLSIDIDDSLTAPSPIYFSLFSKLTHLDLNSLCTEWSLAVVEPFIHLPLLTHLSILPGSNIGILKLFLDRSRCQNLQVVVLWTWIAVDGGGLSSMVTPESERQVPPVEDGRIVFVSVLDGVRDWENGAKGGDDVWKVAEGEMALRRARR